MLVDRAPEQEEYLRDYIPRTCLYSASREIKIEDLYDNLDPRRGVGIEVGRIRYYQALEILLASPGMTEPESLDLRDAATRLALPGGGGAGEPG